MRRRSAVIVSAWIVGFALIGCNLILGSESAIFDPGGPGTEAGDEPADIEASAPDGSGDGGTDSGLDATPCTSTESNPLHCGTCGHDCLGGLCINSRCQPVVVASEVGTCVAITVVLAG